MASRYILPALAIIGSAAAASCSVDSTTTIQNAGDARGLATCTTFSGSIAVATGTSESLDLSGIKEITGGLSADSARNLPGITANDLETIGDSFALTNLTVLSTLACPRLTKVGSINWNGLPALQQLTFTTGIKQTGSLSIQNTQLGALTGINLEMVDTVNLANNGFLNLVNMQLGNVSTGITLNANGGKMVATFPNLIWANNLDINNVTTFEVPSLKTVNKTLNLASNYFTSFSAANITDIGENLIIKDCPQLNNLSFPMLTKITAALTVANNSALQSINAFPKLQQVNGALDFTGNYTNATLPAITTVRGAFNLQSRGDITKVCDAFQPLAGSNNVIQGTFTCKSGEANPTTDGGSGTGTSSGSSSAKSSTAAANPVQLPAITGLLGLVAAIFGLL